MLFESTYFLLTEERSGAIITAEYTLQEKNMILNSDWHIHSEYSYDASLSLDFIASSAKAQGFRFVGITDHLNYNDESFKNDIRRSAAAVKESNKKYPFMVLGVELTPIATPEFEYIEAHGTREGYTPPIHSRSYGIELAMRKDELTSLGVRYAIGAAHWRVDVPSGESFPSELDACLREWYRQQMYLANDERVTVLGHPWYHGEGIWYDDFSLIPRSMNRDIAQALKSHGKYVECNAHFFCSKMTSEKFRFQYADFLRELFEIGIPVTYGSDAHHNYPDLRATVEKYLSKAGFKDGDLTEIAEGDFWL